MITLVPGTLYITASQLHYHHNHLSLLSPSRAEAVFVRVLFEQEVHLRPVQSEFLHGVAVAATTTIFLLCALLAGARLTLLRTPLGSSSSSSFLLAGSQVRVEFLLIDLE